MYSEHDGIQKEDMNNLFFSSCVIGRCSVYSPSTENERRGD